MQEFIGSRVKFILDSYDCGPKKPFVATVVGDSRDLVFVRGEESENVIRLNKTKIAMFEPIDGEPEFVPLQLLYCENASIGCPGVQFVKDGADLQRRDFNIFMDSCPSKCDSCKCGTKGELRSANGELVRAMFAGTIYGDFPKGAKDE